jgi:hypothetical protein
LKERKWRNYIDYSDKLIENGYEMNSALGPQLKRLQPNPKPKKHITWVCKIIKILVIMAPF